MVKRHIVNWELTRSIVTTGEQDGPMNGGPGFKVMHPWPVDFMLGIDKGLLLSQV